MHIDKEKLTSPLMLGGGTFATVALVDLIANGGPAGLVFGALPLTYVAVKYGKGLVGSLTSGVDSLKSEPPVQAEHLVRVETRKRNIAERALGIYPEERRDAIYPDEEDEDEELAPPMQAGVNFSAILTKNKFTPSLNSIYLATLEDGTCAYCPAKDLCHVALAGSTGGGKTSIIRLLMSQLCKAGASVLLLNPHYTNYDIDANEDWTPFLPYLVHDPMECRKYEVIDHYLYQVAKVLLPKRLEKYANSLPVGKPYFLVLDELAAIIAHVPDASRYLADILREGRKVGIYIITASQDFLVKTIAPQGGGAIRECYRTAYYVGGDATTAKVLLDMPANQIPEDELGKGAVMLRNVAVKRATRATVPYVDNDALYRLLGPSTYAPDSIDVEDDMFLEQLSPQSSMRPVAPVPPSPSPVSYGYGRGNGSGSETSVLPEMEPIQMRKRPTQRQPLLSPQLQQALDAYEQGNRSFRDLGLALNINKDAAGKLIRELKERRLIAV